MEKMLKAEDRKIKKRKQIAILGNLPFTQTNITSAHRIKRHFGKTIFGKMFCFSESEI